MTLPFFPPPENTSLHPRKETREDRETKVQSKTSLGKKRGRYQERHNTRMSIRIRTARTTATAQHRQGERDWSVSIGGNSSECAAPQRLYTLKCLTGLTFRRMIRAAAHEGFAYMYNAAARLSLSSGPVVHGKLHPLQICRGPDCLRQSTRGPARQAAVSTSPGIRNKSRALR